MNKSFFGIQPGKQKINSDINTFRESYQPYLKELLPFQTEELEILSFKLKQIIKKKGFGNELQGFLLSIYEEPMVCFHYKTYAGTKKSTTLLARTSNYEFIYRKKGALTKIFLGEEYIGSLTPRNEIVREDNNRMLMQNTSSSSKRLALQMNNDIKAYFTYPETKESINPRAFEINKNVTEGEMVILLALGIYRIVEYLIADNKEK